MQTTVPTEKSYVEMVQGMKLKVLPKVPKMPTYIRTCFQVL